MSKKKFKSIIVNKINPEKLLNLANAIAKEHEDGFVRIIIR